MLAASAALYLGANFVRSDNTPADFALFLALFGGLSLLWAAALSLSRRQTPPLRLVVFGAIVFRLLLLPAGYDFEAGQYGRLLLYDDDVWRYVWEGHVAAVGVDPLKTPPEELEEYQLELENPELYNRIYDAEIWGSVYDNIGYRQFASPYPWTAQAIFRGVELLAPGSVLALKTILVAFDLGNIWLIALLARKLRAGGAAVIAYAWNPLIVKEFAGSGHIDAVLIFFLLAAVLTASTAAGGFLLALSALVKPTPLALAPALFLRNRAAAAGPLLALAALALWTPEGMKAYAEHWVFNPALGRLLPPIRWLEIAFPLTVTGLVVMWRYVRDDGSPRALVETALWTLGAFLLTTPMLAPWYLSWILPFAALLGASFWLALSGSIFLSYHAYLRMGDIGWVTALEFAIPAAVWLWARRTGRGRPPNSHRT